MTRQLLNATFLPLHIVGYSLMILVCLLVLPLWLFKHNLLSKPIRWHRKDLDKRSSLNDLNDDILLEILALLMQSSDPLEQNIDYYTTYRQESFLSKKLGAMRDCLVSQTQSPLRSRKLGPMPSLSMTNRRLRLLAAPNLHRDINIRTDHDWWKALKRLDTIAKSATVGDYARHLTLEIYLDLTWREIIRKEQDFRGPKPPRQFASCLITSLSGMISLWSVTLVLPVTHAASFRQAFAAPNVNSPSDLSLTLGRGMD